MTPKPKNFRLYLDPEPSDCGPHPGYRGQLSWRKAGVWATSPGCEWLYCDDRHTHHWEPVEVATFIPWHRVHSIEVIS